MHRCFPELWECGCIIASRYFLMCGFIFTRNIGFHFTVIKCAFFSVIWRGNVLACETVFRTNDLLCGTTKMG